MDVKVSELRTLCTMLLDHLEKIHGESVNLNVDYYWNIPKEERYNPHEEPRNLNLGQLSEDLSFLKGFLTNEHEPITYGLVWLSTILTAAGEEIFI